jgi:hypothetical protein
MEQIIEETIDNPTETAPVENETVVEGQPTDNDQTPSETEEKNKKLYARTKAAEEEAKSLKEELKKYKEKPAVQTAPSNIDVFNLAKTVSALKDYSVEELGDIQMIAKAKSISPEDAVKTEEAQLLITARRERSQKNNAIPNPSNVSLNGFKVKTVEDVEKMSDSDHKKYVEDFEKRKRRDMGV